MLAAEVDPQQTVVILAAIAAGVWTIWLMIRQTRGSFREAVRDELDRHFDHVTKPAIDEVSDKVDQIKAQVELNDGKSLKDAVVRVEAKVDTLATTLKERDG